jgi:hypothetical protein
LVHRADDDSMEAFEDEWRARQYAGFYPGSVVDCLEPMSCSAAGQFFIDTVHGLPGDIAPGWLCDECWRDATRGALACCEDSCERDIAHRGPCDPRAAGGRETCDRCGKPDRLTYWGGLA